VTLPAPENDTVEAFRVDLYQLYRRAGRPSHEEMARASGRPPVLFAFLSAAGLPHWDEMTAFLTGTGNHAPAVMNRWRRRWVKLGGRSLQTAAGTQPEDWLGEEGGSHRAGPIRLAQVASTPSEFAEALERLRRAANVSYSQIALPGVLTKSTAHRMATGDTLPHRRDALLRFVMACGVTEAEADAWWAIADRIRSGEPAKDQPEQATLLTVGARAEIEQLQAEVLRLKVDKQLLEADNRKLLETLNITLRGFRTVHAEVAARRLRDLNLGLDVPGVLEFQPMIRPGATGEYRIAG
jgi:hypothetical protein